VALRLLGRDCHRCNSAVEGGVVRTRRVWQAPARRRCSAACGARHFSAAGRRRQAAVVPTADPLPSRLAWQEPDSPPRPARGARQRRDLGPRERTLRRMLYETAARAHEVLALDVDELDLRNRCAKGRRKGNAVDVILRQTGTAVAAAWAAQGPPDRPGACNRPARPHRAATRRPRPGHRPRATVVPPRRRAVRAGHRRLSRRTMDAAPASALGAHPGRPGRRQHRHSACLRGPRMTSLSDCCYGGMPGR
jgi:integrase